MGNKQSKKPGRRRAKMLTPELMQPYYNITDTYYQNKSLYLIDNEDNKTNLLIYNTESDTKEKKVIKTRYPLDWGTCIAQLPNGKLFCYGRRDPLSGITLIVDENGEIEKLPYGWHCSFSSAIYYNNSVYCFGGFDYNQLFLKYSNRFDLVQKRWITLNDIPKADASCTGIAFKGNILITGHWNTYLLLYSIDINSFSKIPFDYPKMENKILVNAGRRLFLIGRLVIYESDTERYTHWRWITRASAGFDFHQVNSTYCSGAIYTGYITTKKNFYFKFNLDEKRITELL
ncbi:unnamed protein product [Blepharisma stoltei]|uniref:Kelch motif family protein n=1 Tax=Blepharisma stoltei TaxID=1481888 RepID=A0AAU9K8H7_9CILI|nr:unnamed protein product [Blepharisma stoltei]